MERNYVQTTVYVEPDVLEKINKLSRELQRPKAVMLRRGFDLAILEAEDDAEKLRGE